MAQELIRGLKSEHHRLKKELEHVSESIAKLEAEDSASEDDTPELRSKMKTFEQRVKKLQAKLQAQLETNEELQVKITVSGNENDPLRVREVSMLHGLTGLHYHVRFQLRDAMKPVDLEIAEYQSDLRGLREVVDRQQAAVQAAVDEVSLTLFSYIAIFPFSW